MHYLGDRVVDVHGGDSELARLRQLIETMYAGDTLLYDSLHQTEHGWVLLEHEVGRIPPVIQDLNTNMSTVSQLHHSNIYYVTVTLTTSP